MASSWLLSSWKLEVMVIIIFSSVTQNLISNLDLTLFHHCIGTFERSIYNPVKHLRWIFCHCVKVGSRPQEPGTWDPNAKCKNETRDPLKCKNVGPRNSKCKRSTVKNHWIALSFYKNNKKEQTCFLSKIWNIEN